jgi:hypothetical protein
MKKHVMMGILVMSVAAMTACAQDSAWQLKVTPYAWAMGLDGDVGVRGVTAPVDVKFTDALKNLDLAGMVAAEANNGTWGILFDGAYTKLSDDADTALGEFGVKVKQWTLQGAAVYRVFSDKATTIDVGAGGRFISLKTVIDTPIGSTRRGQDWTDPVIVARVRQQFAEKCFGVLMGDIGGFGTSSDLTWQLTAAVGYSIAEKVSMLFGYRYLDYDYDNGGFTYDVGSSGLALGLQIEL